MWLQILFDSLAYACRLLGWFDPNRPNLQKAVWMIAEYFEVVISIGLG